MTDRPQSNEPLDWRLELERRVSVPEAARMMGISEDTFRRRYPHLIDQVSERRQGVRLKHVVAD